MQPVKMEAEKAEIIICTERGYLENMSMLLIWSIREFGGKYRNLPIYSYQPRKGHGVSNSTARFFEQYEVNLVDEHLNLEYPHYPLANKIVACAHREQNTTADSLIFLDSDIFFLIEPHEWLQFDGHDVILRPVDNKIIGTEGPGDPNHPYWEKLYKLLGVEEIRSVVTTGDQKTIYEYYNSGHLVAKPDTGLFNRWLDNFHLTMSTGLRPGKDMFFLEQSIFAATVSQLKLRVKPVDEMYNLPVFFILQNKSVQLQIEKYAHVKSVHYHKRFKNVYGRNPLYAFLNHTENGKQINSKLGEFGVIKRGSNLEILKHMIITLFRSYLQGSIKR